MAKNPDAPKKPNLPKSKAPKSRASRPEVQPIGPALAELLNPAINRGESGMGSGTGLQPPPDNSWDRRAGGEAAAHRARKSTPKNFVGDAGPRSTPLRSNPQPIGARSSPSPQGGGEKDRAASARESERASSHAKPQGFSESPQSEFAPANYGTSATIPTLDPELAK